MNDTQMLEERLRNFLVPSGNEDWQDVLRRAGEAPSRPARRFTQHRLGLGLAVAACVAVAAPAVVFSGLLPSAHTTAPQRHGSSKLGGRPMGFDPMTLDFMRGAEGISSINVTVNAPTADATMRLQVLRGSSDDPDSNRQIVFQEQVPMTNIAAPAQGPSGVVALSSWSGTLAPSDWDGGCQNMLYTVSAEVVPSGSSFASPPAGSQTVEARSFTCQSG